MFYVTNDTLRALELASLATEAANFKDWWWKGWSCYSAAKGADGQKLGGGVVGWEVGGCECGRGRGYWRVDPVTSSPAAYMVLHLFENMLPP